MPLTPIQKFTKANIPALMQQLEYCLKNPHTALVSAVWNQKGGVAKTTNIVNLGATLALEGKRVLLIDLDPQNDLTRGVGADVLSTGQKLEGLHKVGLIGRRWIEHQMAQIIEP
ncbi:MAG: ParA family protein [Lyngbya sp. HA4199-MV5]|nr:ParA family protein [Lyngbya sp. HA4199-MV5]